jgi:hypothetical protein
MTTFIFLDDLRMPPNDGNVWIVARNIDAAWVELIMAWYKSHGSEQITLSVDHDLGQDEYGQELPNGYELIKRIEAAIACSYDFRPKLTLQIHSANPVGIQNMERGIESIYRFLGK